jgi:hypothetical protein
LRSAGDATLSDLEFQRKLSPEQMREALSLLDSTTGTQNQTVQIEDLRPAEEVNPEPDRSSTTMPTQDRPPAAEDPQQRGKHLNLAVAFLVLALRPSALWRSGHGGKACLHRQRQGSLKRSSRNSRQRRPRKAIPLRYQLRSLHLIKVLVDQSDSPQRWNSQV